MPRTNKVVGPNEIAMQLIEDPALLYQVGDMILHNGRNGWKNDNAYDIAIAMRNDEKLMLQVGLYLVDNPKPYNPPAYKNNMTRLLPEDRAPLPDFNDTDLNDTDSNLSYSLDTVNKEDSDFSPDLETFNDTDFLAPKNWKKTVGDVEREYAERRNKLPLNTNPSDEEKERAERHLRRSGS